MGMSGHWRTRPAPHVPPKQEICFVTWSHQVLLHGKSLLQIQSFAVIFVFHLRLQSLILLRSLKPQRFAKSHVIHREGRFSFTLDLLPSWWHEKAVCCLGL